MKTCSFFGHRNTEETPELVNELKKTVIYLIEQKDVTTFLFGSASKFDDLCLKIATEIKSDHPEIKLIYVRSSYPNINQCYKDYLLEYYDDTIMPKGVEKAGKASYVERNQAMVNASDICVFYYDENYKPTLKKQSKRYFLNYSNKSGTMLAYEYAKKKNKYIFNLFK